MAYSSTDIRNVCLVGPSNAGKTQLAEALLYAGGAITACGSVDQGDTVSDFPEPTSIHYGECDAVTVYEIENRRSS